MNRPSIRNFGIALAICLLSVGAFGYLVREVNQQEELLRSQLATLAVNSEREQASLKLQKTAADSVVDREKLKTYFLQQSGDSITFLNQVETLAPTLGILFKTDSLEEGADKKTKQKWIETKFTFSGSRENVEQFLSVLETTPYLSIINDVSLTAKTADNWEAKVTMRVFIYNYE